MKPIFRFAFPLVQYGLISWALFFVDKYFMESNPVKLGIYITVMNFANGIMLIIQGIQAATQPEVFLYMKKGIQKHSAEIRSLGNMLMAQTQLVIALAIIPTIAYFHLFFETDIKLAATYVSIIYIRFIPRSQYFVYSFAIFYEKKTKFLFLINTINLFIAIWLNYLLIPILNIYGAVIALLVSELIQMLGVFIYSRKTIPIQWNLSKTLYIPLVSLVLIIAVEIVKQFFVVNVYLSGALATLVIFGGLLVAYRNEFKKLINRFV
jgi:O-antigen/teichoic acid export membrane protein